MDNNNWLKLYRKIIQSPVFDNPNLLKMWIWILCKCTHSNRIQMVGLQEVSLNKGEFVFGRKTAAQELQMKESYVYKLLKTLEKMGMIDVKSNNKFSIVSVVNWDIFQCTVTTEEQQSNNKVTTKEQQSNTNKNVKNVKNVKNNITVSKDTVCSNDLLQVIDGWNSLGLTKIVSIKNKRLEMLNVRIREYGLENVLKAIQNISSSQYLKGQNKHGWTITFDWFIKPNNFIKVLEGNYQDRAGGGNHGTDSRRTGAANGESAKTIQSSQGEGERLARRAAEKLKEQGRKLEDIELEF